MSGEAGKATVRPERQLVYEWYTPSLQRSVAFLQAVGFTVQRQEPGFAEMAWGSTSSRLFVEEVVQDGDDDDDDPAPAGYRGNIRILVDDVDAVYQAAMVLPDVKILKKLEDRYYGLRDFTLGGLMGSLSALPVPLLASLKIKGASFHVALVIGRSVILQEFA